MIPQNFAEAYERVSQLVEVFNQNEEFYVGPRYNEVDARKDFIDKFWIALGWDVNHESQTNPYQQEVKVERGVTTSEWRKRADYAFLAPNFRDVRFFVEAKKPHAGLDNPLYYFQTIRYGWNSHVPLSVLTDFEELRVLDCRYKPDIKTALGRAVLKYHYTDYPDEAKFRTIYYLFSREAVLNGSLEDFAKGLPRISRKRARRGVARDEHQNIDEAFLKELDEYREELARAFKRKNPELESEELTEVTQRTLDRLVFMRFLEDKLIEAEPLIENLHQRGQAWRNFISTSRRLDKIYNGIIFKEHDLLDSVEFEVDERTFDKISQNLSHAESPYDFNAIPIHILGSIYERFLGKVIVATGKRARIVEKPEVRKAGGVYYTPEYIVRYIVDNTVGKLIEGKTPEGIRQMRFVDIACGSGSFLLGMYDTLLRYHTAYYNRNRRTQAEGRKAGCIPTEEGGLRLSLLQRRNILLINIYGVDIDPQAVEVAQLSLYLKLLEDETIASAHQTQLEMRESLLPSLSKNIVSGNSLIGWDIFEGKLFDSGEERKLNPMNFDDAFPEVMKRGGFDAIVGNPPYGAQFTSGEKQYLRSKYQSIVGKYDSYGFFIERAISLLRRQGILGYITPHTWLTVVEAQTLRRLVLNSTAIAEIVRLPAKVFKSATVNTILVFLRRASEGEDLMQNIVKVLRTEDESQVRLAQVLQEQPQLNSFFQSEWTNAEACMFSIDISASEQLLLRKIREGRGILQTISDLCVGVQAYDIHTGQKKSVIESRAYHAECRKDRTFRKELNGNDVSRYYHRWTEGSWISYGPWLAHPRQPEFFQGPRLLVREITNVGRYMISADYVEEDYVNYKTILNVLLHPESRERGYHELYVLGLLNSALISWYFPRASNKLITNTFPRISILDMKRFPIPSIEFSDSTDRARHGGMVKLVDQMLEAKKQLTSARTERDKSFYENKCATLDRQIDNLVYELYDLTPEEIAIVEGTGQKADG